MNKNILTITGALLVLVGILGFALPRLLGMHLSGIHNAIHLVFGIMALYFGLKRTLWADGTFSIVFGGIYTLLGLIGLIAGGTHGIWAVIPNQLVFGTPDHITHLLFGGVLLFAGLYRSNTLLPPYHNL